MQIVIDIPDKTYEYFAQGLRYADDVEMAIVAIVDGIQLPKGHGRLKDIDKIEWYGCTTEFDCPHKDRECKDCDRAECSKTQVDNIPTIIEADKAESEEEK